MNYNTSSSNNQPEQPNRNLSDPRITGSVATPTFRLIMEKAPDQDIALTVELVFRQFVRPSELTTIEGSRIQCDEHGEPERFYVCGSGEGRWIKIHPCGRPLLRGVLPLSGPLLLTKNPFKRLQRFAAWLGVCLDGRRVHHTCVLQALALDGDVAYVAQQAGMVGARLHRHRFLPQVEDAASFWEFNFDLERLMTLPRHCGRLPRLAGIVRINQEGTL